MEKLTQNAIWRQAEDLQAIRTECSKDFILPDSYPDIRKILHTAGTLCPGESTVENGRFGDSGNLICKVLFSDENGELHTVSFTLEYSVLAPIKDEGGEKSEATVSAEEILQSVSARALNPRKLALKGKLMIIPHIFFLTEAAPEISPEIPEASIEKKCEPLTYWALGRLNERSLEAGEDLNLPGDSALQEILFTHLNMGTPSCEAVGGSIRFTGEASLELLYRTADGALHFAELPIPFHSAVDADVTSDALCTVKLTPESISCLPAEDAAGEAHGIELDFAYTVSAWIARPIECTRVQDCYSIACPTSAEMGSASAITTLRKMQKQQRRMLTCPSDGMKRCLKAFASVCIDSTERADGRLTLHSIAEVTLLGTDESGAPMTLTLTDAFPWEIEEADEARVLFSVTADPVTEADQVNLTLTVCAELLVWQKSEVGYAASLEPMQETGERKRSAVTLCYPLPGESIWEIAKRYRMPQSVLLTANTLTDGALPRVLLIPSERKAVFSKMI